MCKGPGFSGSKKIREGEKYYYGVLRDLLRFIMNYSAVLRDFSAVKDLAKFSPQNDGKYYATQN